MIATYAIFNPNARYDRRRGPDYPICQLQKQANPERVWAWKGCMGVKG
jgi:hypothetical protein